MTATGSMPQKNALQTLAEAELPRRARRVLEHQLQVATGELRRQLEVVLSEAALELGRQGDHAEDPQQQTNLLGAARRLRTDPAQLINLFLLGLESSLADLRAPRLSRRLEELGTPQQGLSLVDNIEMDEGAVLGSMAARSDSRSSLALQLLGYRYGVIAGAPAFDSEHLPLGPHAVCQALRNAAHVLLPAVSTRLLIYRQFEKISMPHYPALLDALNARLATDGILPHLSFVPVRVRTAKAPAPKLAATTGTGALADARPGIRSDREPESDGGNDDLRGFGLELEPLDIAALPPPPLQLPPTPTAPAVVPGATVASALPRDFQSLQTLLAQRRALLMKLRPASGEERVRAVLASDEVLGLLRRLRTAKAKHVSLSDVRQTLLAQARQLHGHGVVLADDDNDTFELTSLFFTQLQRELRAGTPGEPLVENLKLPLLQLALGDTAFFVDPGHPARMLLDAVSLAAARWLGEDDADVQWLGLLQRAVATVQADPDASRDTFVAANHALQGGLHAAARKTEMAEKRQVEAARGREKLDLARQRATAQIAQVVAARTLPRFHAILLEQAWTDVLSLGLLRNGEDSEAWRSLCADTATIVDASVATSPGVHDAAFTTRIQQALGQVGYHDEDAAAIARQLANGRAEDADLASRTELIVQLKSRTRLGEENATTASGAHPQLTSAEQLARAQLTAQEGGRWVDLVDAADGSIVRRRLAWTSPLSGHALLLNRRGLRVAGDDLDALARMLAAGQLRIVVEDTRPAELAWKATLSGLAHMADGNQAGGNP